MPLFYTKRNGGAAGFAKAGYPQGAALEHELSARMALAWAESEKFEHPRAPKNPRA